MGSKYHRLVVYRFVIVIKSVDLLYSVIHP